MKRLLLILGLCAASCLAALAQISVQVPSVVAEGEAFNLIFTIENQKPSDFSWEPSTGYDVSYGPQTGSSSSISIINGKRTQSSTYTYTYILIAGSSGEILIPQATAQIKGKTIQSKSVTVKVVKGSSSVSSGASSQSSGAPSGSVAPEDLFVRLSLSSRNVMLGEKITASVKLYQRVSIAGFEDVHFPEFTGFWSQETFSASQVEWHREALGEEIYNVALLKSYELIPQQVGDLAIDPAEIVCLVNVRSSRSGYRSIIDEMLDSGYTTIRKRISTKQENIHVRALPEPRPESFAGGVGEYSIKVSLSCDTLKAHDAASLMLTVRGSGNLTLLQTPKINFPPDFDLYDVKVSQKDGSKVFEYPFIPRSAGNFEIPLIEYSFYSPSSAGYKTVTAGPLHLEVLRGSNAESSSGIQTFVSSARDVKDLGSDIRFIHTPDQTFRHKDRFFVGSGLFFALVFALCAICVAVGVLLKERRKKKADVRLSRSRGASKAAKRRLERAGEHLSGSAGAAFYEELHKALLGFVSDKLSLDAADMDKRTIEERLILGGASPETAKNYVSLIENCEFARYSPSADNASMKEDYSRALELISDLAENMNRKKTPSSSALVRTLALVLSLSLPFGSSFAQDSASFSPEVLWAEGVEAYSRGEWQEACAKWEEIEARGLVSPDLMYNIGCAFFKSKDYAHSVLYFERALKLDPSMKDARVNLEFTKVFLQDRIESVPEFFLKGWLRSVRSSLGSDAWAWIFVALFALALSMGLVFLLAKRIPVRRIGFFSLIALLLLSVTSLSFSSASKKAALSSDFAIVVSPVSVVRSAPDRKTGTDLFLLHEGTKVKTLDEVGSWTLVSLSDGRQGWLETEALAFP